MALGGQKRERHRAADAEHVGELQEAFDDADLVADLGTAEDRDQRALGILHDRAEHTDLALHQAAGGAGQETGDALGAGVRPVGGAERVVDVRVGQFRELGRELGVVLGLARLVADVLEHEHLTRCEPLGQLLDLGSDHRRRQRHRRADQLRQAIGDGPQRQVGFAVSWPAQVGDEHQPGAAAAQLLQRGQCRADPGVVGHARRAVGVVGERDVEVDAHENALAVHIEVVEAA